MTIIEKEIQVGDIIVDKNQIVTYIGKYGYTTLNFSTGSEHPNFNFNVKKLSIRRTGMELDQIKLTYPEYFI